MLRKIVFAVIIWISFILQTSVFAQIPFLDTVPNLLMILTAGIGFMCGDKAGLVTGFFCGLLIDLFFGDFLGFHALLMMYIGFLDGRFSGIFYKEDIKLPLALVFASDLTYGVLYYIFIFLLRGKFQFRYYLVRVILPEVVFTVLMAIFLYPLILKINTILEDRERRSEQKFV